MYASLEQASHQSATEAKSLPRTMDHLKGVSASSPHLKVRYSSLWVYSLLKKRTDSVSPLSQVEGSITIERSPSPHRTHTPLPVTTGTAGASNSAASRMN